MGWTWGAVDFLAVSHRVSCRAFARFADPANLGLDWRSLTRDLKPTGATATQ